LKRGLALIAAAAVTGTFATPAFGAFPWEAGDPNDYTTYKLGKDRPRPNEIAGGKLEWMYASTPEQVPEPFVNPLVSDKRELGGVRGAWVVDKDPNAPQAFQTTTGRPDVTIAVLDSGVQWNDYGKPMQDVRLTTRIAKGETPLPRVDRTASTDPAVSCAGLTAGERDVNDDGVFNVLDYACDSRVDPDPPKGVGPTLDGKALLDPQDVLIAFSDGDDDDANGYVDDMVGWDYVDDDNDPFDDVQYGHGSGEARGAAGEANNGNDMGTCPNCMLIHLRVGTSFVADVNNFALAAIYAADNDVEVVQEALGTLNKSRLGYDAVKYAYDHGVTVIASAADEAAQHHNWPSSYPYAIVVNSVTHEDSADPAPTSYLMWNGCTNFSSRITVAIPSVSCSSDATERAAGMAGLVYSAAMNAGLEHPTCRRTDGRPCAISANEVRQLMASGTIGGEQAADDVNFAQDPATGAETEGSCGGRPVPGCTDPFFPIASVAPRLSAPASYPARKGHDQFYGYGRVNMYRAVSAADAKRIPPEVEVTSPEWYEMVDPASEELIVKGEVWARGREYTCRVYVAPGAYPKDTPASEGGDFVEFSRGACDGRSRTAAVSGEIARIAVDDIQAIFPPTSTGDFTGPETGLTPAGTPNPGNNVGRPNKEPYSFVVKVVATAGDLTGTDRRQAYLHRDQDMIEGFPKQLEGDIESSPVLADLDGDNANELLVVNSDGLVHAFRRGGGELDGYPVRLDPLPYHPGSRAFRSGAIATPYDGVLTTPAVGDLDHDGTLEIVIAALKGKVYVIDGETGRRERTIVPPREYSGAPLAPFENVRGVGPDGKYDKKLAHTHRMEAGFIGSPVLADVDADDGGRLEIVAASLDRHVYVWNDDGSDVPGWPVPVVDTTKLQAGKPFDPVTHKPYFDVPAIDRGNEPPYDQGAIITTPAVGDLDGKPGVEIVVGTNESYPQGKDGGINAGGVNQNVYNALAQADLALGNGRLFALKASGDDNPVDGAPAYLPGWPFKVGILQAGLLPMVGEGITGSPIMGAVPCEGTERAPRVGVMPAAGVAYVVNPDGRSCFGRDGEGRDIALNTEGGAATDQPFLAAVGHPAFGELAGGTAFLGPVAGVQRALDVVLPEYQGGQDYLGAWQLELPDGTVRPGWPVLMNDLQFLTGPSVADLSPAPGEEVVAGSAHHDLRAYNSAGTTMDPSWPKLTGDWSVANPTIGTFGDSATRVVVHGTRNGRLLAYETGADGCGPASWPRFHHDLANSGDGRRDAELPGKPTGAALSQGRLEFTSPGDDLMCGTPAAYEVRTSNAPITPASFGRADELEAGGEPAPAGEKASLTLPAGDLERYVAVRARDDQGNVGRPAVVDRGPGSGAPGQAQNDASAPPPGAPAAGPSRPAAEVQGRRNAASCLPARTRLTARGIGPARLGRRYAGSRRTLRWCVRGEGRVTAVLDGRRRARLVVSTARAHRRARVARILRGRRWVGVADRRLRADRVLLRRYLRPAL